MDEWLGCEKCDEIFCNDYNDNNDNNDNCIKWLTLLCPNAGCYYCCKSNYGCYNNRNIKCCKDCYNELEEKCILCNFDEVGDDIYECYNCKKYYSE